jgi:hypothetical protein
MYLVQASKATLPSPRVISGRSLVHRKLSAAQKAAIAARLLAGEVLVQLSTRQLAQLLGVSVPYIRVASQLTPAKREAIANGTDSTTFTSLLSSSRSLALPRPVVSDQQLVNIIRDVGLDRTLAAACAVENVA